MPFISTPERVGRLDGMCKSIAVVLQSRFGEAGLRLMPEIREIYEEEKLEAVLKKALETAASLEEVRQQWSPVVP